MRRFAACLLIAAMGLPFVLAAVVLVRFQVERERIIKEVCVQRARPLEENHCRGECHLRKQLQAQEGVREESPVLPRIELRVEPAVTTDPGTVTVFLVGVVRAFSPESGAEVSTGYISIADPVPWV